MPYSVYKKLYGNYKKVSGSYNEKSKTIVVALPDTVKYEPPAEEEPDKWFHISIKSENVRFYGNSACITLPYHSPYKNWLMWVGKKLVRDEGYCFALSTKETFNFTIKKMGKGRFNKGEVLEQKEITAQELLDIFGYSQEQPEIHVPDELEPVKIEALEELRDE